MKNFKELARQEIGGSPIIAGRVKIKMADIAEKYPDGITLTGFDLLKGRKNYFSVWTFAENPIAYFCGGQILTGLANRFAVDESSGEMGNCAEISDELARAGGLRVKLRYGTTQSGNTVVLVDMV